MRLIDGINQAAGVKVSDGRVEIPDCCRDDLPQLFVDLGLKVGAEIGVERGLFSEKLLRAGLQVTSIDPWIHNAAWAYHRTPARMAAIYEEAKAKLAPYPNSTILRMMSMQAVELFADESLDFCYIDGNHEFRYVAEDIYEWTKKVRKGGIVSGHDYFTPKTTSKAVCAVAPILHAYVGWFDIKTWYVLGRKVARPGEQREVHRSWMFVKG
jgi:hypothetical protein